MLEFGKFKKSRHSGANCVEVALVSKGHVAVRNSRSIRKKAHVYTPDEWKAFVAGVKDGEFDYPSA